MTVYPNFFADDIPSVIEKIPEFDGTITAAPKEYDLNPTQPVKALFGRFKDPDGHEHYLVKETLVKETARLA
jgi:hypothetical protein